MKHTKRGIYETDYGNAAVVIPTSGRTIAYDLDSAEFIPAELVSETLIREADESEIDMVLEMAEGD